MDLSGRQLKFTGEVQQWECFDTSSQLCIIRGVCPQNPKKLSFKMYLWLFVPCDVIMGHFKNSVKHFIVSNSPTPMEVRY